MPGWVRMTSMNALSVFTHDTDNMYIKWSILPHMLTTKHGIQHNCPTTMNDIKWQKWVWVSLNAMNQRSKIWCYARWIGLIFARIQCINSPSLEHEVLNNTTIQAVHSQAFCPMLSWNLGIFNRNIAHISVPWHWCTGKSSGNLPIWRSKTSIKTHGFSADLPQQSFDSRYSRRRLLGRAPGTQWGVAHRGEDRDQAVGRWVPTRNQGLGLKKRGKTHGISVVFRAKSSQIAGGLML